MVGEYNEESDRETDSTATKGKGKGKGKDPQNRRGENKPGKGKRYCRACAKHLPSTDFAHNQVVFSRLTQHTHRDTLRVPDCENQSQTAKRG